MSKIRFLSPEYESAVALPFADEGVHAGFPSPAQHYMENSIDLNRDLISHPESTFYARVEGESMRDANILPGDLLVIDKSRDARTGDVCLCIVEGEFTVKTVEFFPDHVRLVPANPEFKPMEISGTDSFEVWGVVTYVIHKV